MSIRSWPLVWACMALLALGGCEREGGNRHTASMPAPTAETTQPGAELVAFQKASTAPLPQRQAGEFLHLVPPSRQPKDVELASIPVSIRPVIDGRANEQVWQAAPVAKTLDFASQREITLQSIYTHDEVFFLVTYPDGAPSETHKSWQWNATEGVYKQMNDREDMFVFKWSMVGNEISLAFRDFQPHRADIWFWKARRTNPAGYADDKWQSFTPRPHEEAKRVASQDRGTLYLRRVGDAGRSAYEERIFYDARGPWLPKYYPRQPEGSRADVRAKGVWQDGKWTIEFARKLATGHEDDVTFAPGGVYAFAVSCYEMAATEIEPAWDQPLYRSGDAFDRLLLRLAPKETL